MNPPSRDAASSLFPPMMKCQLFIVLQNKIANVDGVRFGC